MDNDWDGQFLALFPYGVTSLVIGVIFTISWCQFP